MARVQSAYFNGISKTHRVVANAAGTRRDGSRADPSQQNLISLLKNLD